MMKLGKLCFLFLIGVGLLSGASLRAELALNGGGSSFDLPAFTKWFAAYRQVKPDVSFNYQPNGSGFGQSSVMNQTLDFGASDFTLDDSKLAQSHNGIILQLPIVAGAVVLSYNVPDNPKLKFDGPTIAQIFLGKITSWDDAKIAALNPGISLPKADIVTVHRSDTSGTSFIFTDYLTAVSPEWAKQVGRSGSPKWPGGIGGKANAGVAGQIKQLPGAIGYVELAYAVQNHLAFASVKNADGTFVDASPASVSAALESAKIPDDYRFSMVNAPGRTVYPIAGASWVLLYQKQSDGEKAKALVAFLKWVATEGQRLSPSLEYAPLPQALQDRVVKSLDSVKS